MGNGNGAIVVEYLTETVGIYWLVILLKYFIKQFVAHFHEGYSSCVKLLWTSPAIRHSIPRQYTIFRLSCVDVREMAPGSIHT